jgi:hypothetical protein
MSEEMKPAFDFIEELKAIATTFEGFHIHRISLEHTLNINQNINNKRISICAFYTYRSKESNFSVHCFENSSRLNRKVLRSKLIEEIEQITSSTLNDIAV